MTTIIAIVGRPNVGKSSLFNRILGKRAAVVDDIPGVTRDRNYRPSSWQGQDFLLVDTGGMVPDEKKSISSAVNQQIRIAIDEAAAVLFVVEAPCGITGEDEHIAKLLRKKVSDKVFLIINKSESSLTRFDIDTFRSLGLGDPHPLSALHGNGVADLLDTVIDFIKRRGGGANLPPQERRLGIAVVGRPNAGKSSLINKLLQKNRLIVDDVPGTTRDSIDTEMKYRGRPVRLIDTAGLRKKSHVKQNLEYYFNLRAIKSIERCDVCVVLVDASESIGVQDLRIIDKVSTLRKGILLAWNKWDLVKKDHTTFGKIAAEVKGRYLEARHIPLIAISALTGQRVTGVLDQAFAIHERMTVRVPAAEFEDAVFAWVRAHPHPAIPKEPVRFLGARQITATFPLFRFFVTYPRNVASSYVRYLTNKIHETYSFEGCPVVLEFREVKKPTHRTKGSFAITTGENEEAR